MVHIAEGERPEGAWIRPEVVAIVCLVLSIPLLGALAYKSMRAQVEEVLDGLSAHPCHFYAKSPLSGDGYFWDFTQLPRKKSQCPSGAVRCRDYSVARDDEVFYLNMCANAMNKPRECRLLYGSKDLVPKAVGYQTADGVCYSMGDLSTGQWSLINPNKPRQGLKLTYSGGSQCDGYTFRSVEYHFECDPNAGIGVPRAVFGDCEFVVLWRTAHACPTRPSTLLPIFFWAFFVVGAYLLGRFVYNIRVKQMMLDWDAVPHIRLVRMVGASIMIFAYDLAPRFSEQAEAVWERYRPGFTRREYARPVHHGNAAAADDDQY